MSLMPHLTDENLRDTPDGAANEILLRLRETEAGDGRRRR